ncbi:MAG: PhzF family phenazine biosynthesis protein [Peptoniphilus sp.]|nr:PhzF family phenazine biosynthesis protein [Peptoniphilus sp.]MDD7363019.1 PhzF family phenazine biosynthesis protein [Bacillota bacterium]MDY6045284.1 PhzF family phenazine biosynthesis protein [Peptoniphilus sp.]
MRQFIVDAFTDTVFKGNPAAVCLPDRPLSDELMLKIAMENNLSETAFIAKDGENYLLRWFTPKEEVDLCGHATLASAFIVLNVLERDRNDVTFDTLSGKLKVARRGDLFEMDFPAYELEPVAVTRAMEEAVGAKPREAYMGRDLLLVMDDDYDIDTYPDMKKVLALDGLLLHVTKRGDEYDCISRSFAPKLNVPEDPVCGSGHCHISVYWSSVLHKPDILAFQASPRTGILHTSVIGDRVTLAGGAVLYSRGQIHI